MNFPSSANKQLFSKWAIIIVLFLIAHLSLFTSTQNMRSFPDSNVFITASNAPIYSQSIWAGKRPPLTSLFYKIIRKKTLIPWLQLSVSILSWSLLAVTIYQSTNTPNGKATAVIIVLGLSLTSSVSQWHQTLLSESFALSALALLIATWLFFLHTPTRLSTTAVVAASLLIASSRDTYSYTLLVTSPILIFLALTFQSKYKISLFVIGLSGLLIFSASALSANIGQRWVFPFYNIISQRILPYSQPRQFFTHHGMPLNSTLSKLTNMWASSDNYTYYTSPELDKFREWATKYGRSTYLKYLTSHPVYFLLSPLHTINHDFTANLLDYAAPGYTPLLRSSILMSLINPYAFIFYSLASLITIVFIAIRSPIKKNTLYWVATALIITSYLHYLIVWHGDAMEISRHALPAAIQFRLGIWFLIILLIDRPTKQNKST